jgi:hypothetical protein
MAFHGDWVVEPSRLIAQEPNPEFFRLLRPGQRAAVRYRLAIQLRTRRHQTLLAFGQTYVLQVQMDHWATSHRWASRLRKQWQSQGLLWTTKDMLEPIILTIDSSPQLVRCGPRVD